MSDLGARIIAGMATIEKRRENLPDVLGSLCPQLDHIYVYCNDYTPDQELQQLYPNVTFVYGGKDLGANGKFFFLDRPGGYYFSVDDDFIYPENYVERMVNAIQWGNGRVVACVHGSILPPKPDWYFERIQVFASREELKTLSRVNLPGTGAVAFRKELLNIPQGIFQGDVMCDLDLAIFCQRHEVPIVAIPRPKDWLVSLPTHGVEYWTNMLIDDKGRTELAREVDWSFFPSVGFPVKPGYWEQNSHTWYQTRYRSLLLRHAGVKLRDEHDVSRFMKQTRMPTDELRVAVNYIESTEGLA